MIINLSKRKFYKKKEKNSIYRLSMAPDSYFGEESDEFKEFQNLIEVRKKRRISVVECMHSAIRITMLWFSLKFPQ